MSLISTLIIDIHHEHQTTTEHLLIAVDGKIECLFQYFSFKPLLRMWLSVWPIKPYQLYIKQYLTIVDTLHENTPITRQPTMNATHGKSHGLHVHMHVA